MPGPVYEIGVAAVDEDPRVAVFSEAISELVADLGADRFANVTIKGVEELALEVPTVVVVLWDDELADDRLLSRVDSIRTQGVTVLPVVRSNTAIANLPKALTAINAMSWDNDGRQVARACLRELGLHESSRGVFISHRRADGLIVAEQLFEAFSKSGWRPFVDRFAIDAGADVQDRIEESMEEAAFLLLVESPDASTSPWVQYEVFYALERHLGLAIVNINDAPKFPATADLPRHRLVHPTHLNGTHIVLAKDAVDEVVELVETTHAIALARRRRQLLVSAMTAARAAGRNVEAAPGWRLHVRQGDRAELLGVLPHLPVPNDLYEIDMARNDIDSAVLVHAAHVIDERRRRILNWVVGERPIELVPNNAIGARWAGG